MKRAAAIALMGASTIWGLGTAEARPNYVSLIPNHLGCETCHTNPEGGGSRDSFGEDFGRADRDWSTLFDLDSDGDGFSNGAELGDPEGTWRQGDPSPNIPFSDPGDRNSQPAEPGTCGDGVQDEGEACDTDDLGGETCLDMGFEGGFLTCDDGCRLDTSTCQACGDGIRQDDEACDGFDVGGRSCNTEGFTAGRLSCTPECTLDATACSACGNGVAEGDEDCDGDDLKGATCGELMPGTEGALACDERCALVLDNCAETPNPQPDPQPETPTPEPAPDLQPEPDTDGGCAQVPGQGSGSALWLALLLLVVGLRRQASHRGPVQLQ